MLKNRLFGLLLIGSLTGLAACGDDAADTEVMEELPETAPERNLTGETVPVPAVTEGAIIMDTSVVGTPAPADTSL